MLEISISPEAENDLAKIFQYTIHSFGAAQADKYQDELYNGMLQISEFPKIGKNYSFGSYEYRFLHVNRHLLFYRLDRNVCLIVRVLHEKMSIENL